MVSTEGIVGVRGQPGGDVSQEWRNIVRDHMKMFVYKPV